MGERKRLFANFIVSLLSQMIIVFLCIIIPRIIIIHYDSDTNGLLSTITQVFTYMALLESGISLATRNALFKPLKENNKEEISIVLSASRSYYRRIALIYFAFVIVLSFILPFVLNTSVDYWTIVIVVFFEGLTNVVSFYFLNHWACFLNSSGKSAVSYGINFLSSVLCYISKIVLAIFSVNIAFMQIVFFGISLMKLAIYYIYTKKKYGWLNCQKKTNFKLPDRNSYVLGEISWTVFTSTDIVILSIFISTATSSVYMVYNMVFFSLSNILKNSYEAISYNIGKSYHEDKEKCKKIHDLFSMFFMSCITVLMCVSYFLIMPFIKMYTKDITDINYINENLPILFCIIQLLSWSRYVPETLLGVAGYAKQSSIASLLEAIINIILSVILVNFFGIIGVLIATIVALPIKVIYANWLVNHKIFKRLPLKICVILGVNYLLFGITVILKEFVFAIDINSIGQFILSGFILTFIYVIIALILNLIVNKDLIMHLFKKGKIAK